MRKRLLVLIYLGICTCSTSVSAKTYQRATSFREAKADRLKNLPRREFNCKDDADNFVPGQVVIKYKTVPEQTQSHYRTLVEGKKFSLKKLANNSTVTRDFFNKIYLVTDETSFQNFKSLKTIKDGDCQNVLQMIEEIKKDSNVEIAEPNLIYKSMATVNDPLMNEGLYPPGLWGLKKIDVETAWNVTQGSNVVVAVIDSGVDWNHPDLLANIPYIGYDYIYDDIYPEDGTGHGTHVAGTIAAVGNNNRGVVGVAYKAKVFPIRVLNEYGSAGVSLTTDLIDALNQAASNNVKVVNFSLKTPTYSQFLDQACNLLYESGIAIVASSGNGGTDGIGDNELTYPAAYASVMAVGSTNENDELSEFSNYGDWVDVAAPGENIVSTFSNNAYLTCLNAGSTQCLGPALYSDNSTTYGYALSRGTSMSAPHVSGLAALLFSYYDSLTADDVLGIIAINTDSINTNKAMGGGRINAASAVGFALGLKCFEAVDTNRDSNITDLELLKLADALNRGFTFYNKQIDIDNNGVNGDSDVDSFREVIISDLSSELQLNFEKYYASLYVVDSKRPYGIISLQEKKSFKTKVYKLIKAKKYNKSYDVDFDGYISINDYNLAISVLNRLGL